MFLKLLLKDSALTTKKPSSVLFGRGGLCELSSLFRFREGSQKANLLVKGQYLQRLVGLKFA